MASGRFSRPADLQQDQEFGHAVRFAVDRRHAAVVPVLSTNPGSNVVTVSDESLWESVAEMGAAVTFGRIPGALGVAVNSAYARSALRPQARVAAGPASARPQRDAHRRGHDPVDTQGGTDRARSSNPLRPGMGERVCA